MASHAYPAIATPLSGFGMDLDRRDKCQQPREAMLFEDLSGSEEIVPDSDDEEMERREKLRKGSIVAGSGSIGLGNQRPIVNGLIAEDGERGVVADSEDECDEGRQRVLNGHGRVFGNSYVSGKEKLECFSGSRQPEDSSQADALKFSDYFLKCNDLNLSSEGKSESHMKQRSPPKSCTKCIKIAQKISNTTPAVGFGSYEWINKQLNKQGRLLNRRDVLFYTRQRKKCAMKNPVISTMKFIQDNISSVSSYQPEKKEVTNLSNESNDEPQMAKTFISGPEEVEVLHKEPKTVAGNVDKESDVETRSKLLDSGADEGVNETFNDVFNTQMAAEVIESFSFEPPVNCSALILSDSFQNIITDCPKEFKEKDAKPCKSSLLNGTYSGLNRNGDISKVNKRSNNQSGSHKLAFHENGPVDPRFSAGNREARYGIKVLVHTYKRRRPAMVRKENRSPNINSDMGEVKSNIESREEHKNLSNVIPGRIALNILKYPKGKRTNRVSSNTRHLDSIDKVRSDAETEKEVKAPLPKRYKPANHCAEPAWVKYPRKTRTSAASKKQVMGGYSCTADASRRSCSDCNKLQSSVGIDAGSKAIFYDSNTVHGSNSLIPVSSNSGIVPLYSNLNSAASEKLSAKMPESLLIRELTELGGFSDIPLNPSCKNLRSRKHVANIRVLLSRHLDSSTIMQQKKVLARLGISIAASASDATHFVTNTFSRTKNMLEAIALGIPIVTQIWLESCAEAGCLVDEKSYILKDPKKEKEIGFSLSASLAKAARYPLLKDRKVLITPNIKPDKGMLSSLVKMVQGEVLEITKNCQPEDVIVLSCEEDCAILMPFLEKGISIYHSELLLNGIVTQKLDLQRHQLFRDRVKSPLPHMLKRCKR